MKVGQKAADDEGVGIKAEERGGASLTRDPPCDATRPWLTGMPTPATTHVTCLSLTHPAASHYRYAAPPLPFSAAPLGVGSSFSPQPAADLAVQRNISIADLRLKAKRHAEALGLDDKST